MGLTREDIISGRIENMIIEAERLGLSTRLSPEERRKSKEKALARFAPDEEVWLFGYGSLMWNPCIHYVDHQRALVFGYHRSFCLQTLIGRGTPERCGLVLALEPGGSCQGIAFRIAAELADAELDIVWNREMISGAYQPRVVKVQTPLGVRRAITFIMDRQHPRYLGGLNLQAAATMIAHAKGELGTCAEYLFNTVQHLDELGIVDGPMHRLKCLVQELLAELPPGNPPPH